MTSNSSRPGMSAGTESKICPFLRYAMPKGILSRFDSTSSFVRFKAVSPLILETRKNPCPCFCHLISDRPLTQ